MQIRHWLGRVVITGFLIAIALIPMRAFSQPQISNPDNSGKYVEPAGDPEKAKAAFDAWFWQEAKSNPETYNSICDHPADRDYASLCQQWRAAKAATDSEKWALLQLIISVFISVVTAVGLIATIVYTHKTLRLTNQTSRADLRAYLGLKDIHWDLSSDWEASGYVPVIQAQIMNFGRTPARNATILYTYRISKPENPSFDLSEQHPIPFGTIMPGQDINSGIVLEGAPWKLFNRVIQAGNMKVYFFGEIHYIDCFDADRTTTFRAELSMDAQGITKASFHLSRDGNEAT